MTRAKSLLLATGALFLGALALFGLPASSPPTVAVVSPGDGAVTNQTTLDVEVSFAPGQGKGNPHVTLIELRADGNLVASQDIRSRQGSGGTATLAGVDLSTFANTGSPVSLVARAYQGSPRKNVQADSAPVHVLLDSLAPLVNSFSPANGAFTSNPRPLLSARAADAGGSGLDMTSLILRLDGSPVNATIAPDGVGAAVLTFAPPADLAPGPHAVSATAEDTAGNSSSASIQFVVDAGPPVLIVLAPENNQALNTLRPEFSATVNDPGGAGVDPQSIVLRLDGTPVAPTILPAGGTGYAVTFTPDTPLSEGLHTFLLNAGDLLGNAAPTASVSFVLDATPPLVVQPAPADGATSGPRPVVSALWSDAGTGIALATALIRLDGVDVTGQSILGATGFSHTPAADLSTGIHSVAVEIRDAAGNAGLLSWAFFVAVGPPPPSITSPASGTVFTDPTVLVAGTSAAAGLVITLHVDGLAAGTTTSGVSGAWSMATPTLVEGTHVLTATASDGMAVSGPSPAVTVLVDLTSPAITQVTSSTADGTYGPGAPIDLTIHFSEPVTLSGGGLQVTLDTGRVLLIPPFGPTSSVSFPWIVGPGENSADLTALTPLLLESGASLRDSAGRDAALEIPSGQNLGTFKSLVIDTTAPLIFNADPPQGSTTTGPTPTLSASWSDPSGIAPATARILLDGFDVTSLPGTQIQETGFTHLPVSALAPGEHAVQAEVKDIVGNQAVLAWTFTVPAPDTTPPQFDNPIPVPGSSISERRPPISVNWSDPAGSGVDPASALILVDGQDVTGLSVLTGNGFTHIPPDALVLGDHSVTVQVSDFAGNAAAHTWSFTIIESSDSLLHIHETSVASERFSPLVGSQYFTTIVSLDLDALAAEGPLPTTLDVTVQIQIRDSSGAVVQTLTSLVPVLIPLGGTGVLTFPVTTAWNGGVSTGNYSYTSTASTSGGGGGGGGGSSSEPVDGPVFRTDPVAPQVGVTILIPKDQDLDQSQYGGNLGTGGLPEDEIRSLGDDDSQGSAIDAGSIGSLGLPAPVVPPAAGPTSGFLQYTADKVLTTYRYPILLGTASDAEKPPALRVFLNAIEVSHLAARSGDNFICDLNGKGVQLDEGTHVFRCEGLDAGGNVTAVTKEVLVDRSRPQVLMTAPASADVFRQEADVTTMPDITVEISMADDGVGLKLDTFKVEIMGQDVTSSFTVLDALATAQFPFADLFSKAGDSGTLNLALELKDRLGIRAQEFPFFHLSEVPLRIITMINERRIAGRVFTALDVKQVGTFRNAARAASFTAMTYGDPKTMREIPPERFFKDLQDPDGATTTVFLGLTEAEFLALPREEQIPQLIAAIEKIKWMDVRRPSFVMRKIGTYSPPFGDNEPHVVTYSHAQTIFGQVASDADHSFGGSSPDPRMGFGFGKGNKGVLTEMGGSPFAIPNDPNNVCGSASVAAILERTIVPVQLRELKKIPTIKGIKNHRIRVPGPSLFHAAAHRPQNVAVTLTGGPLPTLGSDPASNRQAWNKAKDPAGLAAGSILVGTGEFDGGFLEFDAGSLGSGPILNVQDLLLTGLVGDESVLSEGELGDFILPCMNKDGMCLSMTDLGVPYLVEVEFTNGPTDLIFPRVDEQVPADIDKALVVAHFTVKTEESEEPVPVPDGSVVQFKISFGPNGPQGPFFEVTEGGIAKYELPLGRNLGQDKRVAGDRFLVEASLKTIGPPNPAIPGDKEVQPARTINAAPIQVIAGRTKTLVLGTVEASTLCADGGSTTRITVTGKDSQGNDSNTADEYLQWSVLGDSDVATADRAFRSDGSGASATIRAGTIPGTENVVVSAGPPVPEETNVLEIPITLIAPTITLVGGLPAPLEVCKGQSRDLQIVVSCPGAPKGVAANVPVVWFTSRGRILANDYNLRPNVGLLGQDGTASAVLTTQDISPYGHAAARRIERIGTAQVSVNVGGTLYPFDVEFKPPQGSPLYIRTHSALVGDETEAGMIEIDLPEGQTMSVPYKVTSTIVVKGTPGRPVRVDLIGNSLPNAYYPMDNLLNNTMDDRFRNHDGTVAGAVLDTAMRARGAGSYRFDGAALVSVPDHADLRPTADLELEVFVATTQAGGPAFLAKGSDYGFVLDAQGHAVFFVSTPSGIRSISSAGLVNDGSFHQITGRYSLGVLAIGVDGYYSSVAVGTTALLGSGASLVLGNGFVGRLDELEIRDTKFALLAFVGPNTATLDATGTAEFTVKSTGAMAALPGEVGKLVVAQVTNPTSGEFIDCERLAGIEVTTKNIWMRLNSFARGLVIGSTSDEIDFEELAGDLVSSLVIWGDIRDFIVYVGDLALTEGELSALDHAIGLLNVAGLVSTLGGPIDVFPALAKVMAKLARKGVRLALNLTPVILNIARLLVDNNLTTWEEWKPFLTRLVQMLKNAEKSAFEFLEDVLGDDPKAVESLGVAADWLEDVETETPFDLRLRALEDTLIPFEFEEELSRLLREAAEASPEAVSRGGGIRIPDGLLAAPETSLEVRALLRAVGSRKVSSSVVKLTKEFKDVLPKKKVSGKALSALGHIVKRVAKPAGDQVAAAFLARCRSLGLKGDAANELFEKVELLAKLPRFDPGEGAVDTFERWILNFSGLRRSGTKLAEEKAASNFMASLWEVRLLEDSARRGKLQNMQVVDASKRLGPDGLEVDGGILEAKFRSSKDSVMSGTGDYPIQVAANERRFGASLNPTSQRICFSKKPSLAEIQRIEKAMLEQVKKNKKIKTVFLEFYDMPDDPTEFLRAPLTPLIRKVPP